MNIAMILAGGVGARTGLNYPKQFYTVNNKPVIVYTLEKFQMSPSIDVIEVVCADEWKLEVMSYKEKYGITKLIGTAKGGSSGLYSALNGLLAMDWAEEEDYVLIHDSVRPFIDVDTIENNIEVAHQYGVAMTATKCVETLVYAEDGSYAEKVVPRDGLYRIQTPQTFTKGKILDLLEKTDLDNCNEPSTFSLWMAMGNPIYCSKGNEKNIKITYPEDIDYFKRLFSN